MEETINDRYSLLETNAGPMAVWLTSHRNVMSASDMSLKSCAKRNYSALSQVRGCLAETNVASPNYVDELRHIIGSETTRRGLLLLFELLQNETLNRRFVYIVLESLLIKLFQPNDMKLIFEKLYSRSARVKDEYRRRTMKRDYSISSISTDSPSLGGSSARGDLQQRFFAKNPSKSFQ